METPSTPPLEELLSHADWARALARRIVRDEQRADDVVQEAWLAAVERPPRPEPGLRVWFARLVRNLANNLRRAEQRRARHERGAAAAALAPPSSAPIVDELAAQQLVAQALLALDEPYRETLIRRWYRDEKPAAIARAMQVPVKTVDTRLARGLERLRAELTARRGGTSREWCLMLAPLAQAGTATGVVAAWTGGALTMTGLAKLAAAVTVVAAASVATWSKVAAHRLEGSNTPQERPVASAQDARGAQAPAIAVAAADGATRSTEPRATPAPVDDPLAKYRGDWHLHGRVVEEGTGKPIAGCAVTAWWGHGINFAPPWLGETTTDADGLFTLERLADTTGVSLRADGHVTRYASFGASELADDRAAAPRTFELEPRTYGSLVIRLCARDGQPLPRRITERATVVYGPYDGSPESKARFEGLPNRPTDGTPTEWFPAERSGDVFRIERAPARTDLRSIARIGGEGIAAIRIAPLAAGETREVPFAVDCGIVTRVSCVDAETRERVAVTGLTSPTPPTLRWTGPRPRDHARRLIAPDSLDGELALPGPGHVEIEGALAGYAPFRVVADVVDGTPIEIALTRGRQLYVKVRDERGEPWKLRVGRPEPGATTRLKFSGFLAAGRAPDCVVVSAGAPLPSELDPDAPVAATLHRRMTYQRETKESAIDGFTGFAPQQRLRVGIYDDGRLVGSTDVPATAPLLAESPPSRPADATQTVTVEVALAPPAEGALRFRVVAPDDGKPVAAYGVALRPIVRDDDRADALDVNFEVTDAADGAFSFSAIPAGDWRMGIFRDQPFVEEWVGRVSIDAGRTTDLGTLTVGVSGTLEVQVVEEGGSPAIDAEIRVTTADVARPLEFRENVTLSCRQTTVRTIARPGPVELGLPAGCVRVEVRSEGFAAAFAIVNVPAAGKATCTITLKSLDPNEPTAEPPADPSKR
jgi:RNA polymerase sigma-70 factor (ECF subfamily)